MKSGKLSPFDLQASVFRYLGERRPEVLVHARLGEDCSVLDLGDDVLVVSTDPITGTAINIGRLSVIVSCNDVASCGAEPVGLLLSILAPEGSDIAGIEEAMRQVDAEAKAQRVEVIGGHTEITDSVTRMVICSTVIGRARRDSFVTSSGAQPGDSIIVTKSVGLEGTAILAYDRAERLSQLTSGEIVSRAQHFIGELSVVREGLVAVKGNVSAMHDATEGGLLGALYELAMASGVGFEVDLASVPICEETRLICGAARIDPLRLMSSGSMIIATPDPEGTVDRIQSQGVRATVVGRITADRTGYIVDKGDKLPVGPPEGDQLYIGLANLK
jgi:hydrogenase expression/formation protein HypE